MLRAILIALQFKMFCWEEILGDHILWPNEQRQQALRELDWLLKTADQQLVDGTINQPEATEIKTEVRKTINWVTNCR